MLPVTPSSNPLSPAIFSSHNLSVCDYLVKPFRNPLFLITQIVQVCINFIIAGSVFSAIILSGGVYLISLALYWIRCSSSPKNTQTPLSQPISYPVHTPLVSPNSGDKASDSAGNGADPHSRYIRRAHTSNPFLGTGIGYPNVLGPPGTFADESNLLGLPFRPMQLFSSSPSVTGDPSHSSSAGTVGAAAGMSIQQRPQAPPNVPSSHVSGSSSSPLSRIAAGSALSDRPPPAPNAPRPLVTKGSSSSSSSIAGSAFQQRPQAPPNAPSSYVSRPSSSPHSWVAAGSALNDRPPPLPNAPTPSVIGGMGERGASAGSAR